MQNRVLPIVLLVSACATPGYEAVDHQEFTVPAASLSALACRSHNGDIVVTGRRDTGEVLIRVERRVRGFTPLEAEENLASLEVRRTVADGWLDLEGVAPADMSWRYSPSFAFTLEVPASFQARLSSHNGEVQVRGLEGAVAVETHNGAVFVQGSPSTITVETHNGEVLAEVDGSGPLSGSVNTHNGAVLLTLGPGRAAAVEADTHNGSMSAKGDFRIERAGDDYLRVTKGQGGGRVRITTHNGAISIR